MRSSWSNVQKSSSWKQSTKTKRITSHWWSPHLPVGGIGLTREDPHVQTDGGDLMRAHTLVFMFSFLEGATLPHDIFSHISPPTSRPNQTLPNPPLYFDALVLEEWNPTQSYGTHLFAHFPTLLQTRHPKNHDPMTTMIINYVRDLSEGFLRQRRFGAIRWGDLEHQCGQYPRRYTHSIPRDIYTVYP